MRDAFASPRESVVTPALLGSRGSQVVGGVTNAQEPGSASDLLVELLRVRGQGVRAGRIGDGVILDRVPPRAVLDPPRRVPGQHTEAALGKNDHGRAGLRAEGLQPSVHRGDDVLPQPFPGLLDDLQPRAGLSSPIGIGSEPGPIRRRAGRSDQEGRDVGLRERIEPDKVTLVDLSDSVLDHDGR